MKSFGILCASSVLSAVLASHALAQHSDHAAHAGQMNHGPTQAQASEPVLPTETGQSAFAAIAEIVALLSADPDTDWSKVDINALRAHLRDMDLVTLRSAAQTTPLDDGARFEIRGEGAVGDAVRRMTLAHAPFLEAEGPWNVEAKPTATGAVLTVRTGEPAVVAKIQGLGFYGLMALGAHHQPHHWAMARGDGDRVHKH